MTTERKAFIEVTMANLLIMTSLATLLASALSIAGIVVCLKAASTSNETGFHNAGVLGQVAAMMTAIALLGAAGMALFLQAADAHRRANRPRIVHVQRWEKRKPLWSALSSTMADFHEASHHEDRQEPKA